MSVSAMAWVWRQNLTPMSKIVLLAIADHADDDGGNAYPSKSTLALKTGYSERQVIRIVNQLTDEGWLSEERRHVPGIRPDRMPKVYQIVMRRGDILTGRAETLPLDGVTSVTLRGDIRDVDGVTWVSPEPSIEPSLEPTPAAARKVDPLWDAVVDACGLSGSTLTKSERGRVAVAVSELRAVGADPAEVSVRAQAYRRKWPNVDLTATALAANWSMFAAKGPRRVGVCRDCEQPLENHHDDMCQILSGRREFA
jgi:hypothetical protein